MASPLKQYVVLLILSLAFTKGFCVCSLNDITIGTVRSGREIKGKPEWNVEVINTGDCAQSHLILSCKEFNTLEPIDPSIFVKHGDECLILRGQPLLPKASVKFSYAWDPIILRALSSTIVK